MNKLINMDDKNIYISQEGMEKLEKNRSVNGKNFYWTSDIDCELPILMAQEEVKNATPETLFQYY